MEEVKGCSQLKWEKGNYVVSVPFRYLPFSYFIYFWVSMRMGKEQPEKQAVFENVHEFDNGPMSTAHMDFMQYYTWCYR